MSIIAGSCTGFTASPVRSGDRRTCSRTLSFRRLSSIYSRSCAMAKGNGYLRVGEFRSWTAGLGQRLDKLDDGLAGVTQKVDSHAQLLAVFKDRADTRTEQVRIVWGVITAL